MDIRHFFKKRKVDDGGGDDNLSESSNTNNNNIIEGPSVQQNFEVDLEEAAPSVRVVSVIPQSETQSLHTYDENVNVNDLDIGLYVNSRDQLSIEKKLNLIEKTLAPASDYDFPKDSSGTRSFRHVWLEQYSPWLAYSVHSKGALCKYCVLFPQPVTRGLMGSFIKTPFVKYKKFHDAAKSHMTSSWHKGAVEQAQNFLSTVKNPELRIINQMDTAMNEVIEKNRQKLSPILSSIIFCGTHDLAIRGKEFTDGNFQDLLNFRIEAGDSILKDHIETARKNAKYTSVRTQNELISIIADVLRDEIVQSANKAVCFSLIADETADISGTEQLSIGVRFIDQSGDVAKVREEFLGFVPLQNMDAETIAETIIDYGEKIGLNLDEKLMGQGYDGCSTMAGKDNGVQARVRRTFPKALFVHCSSHRYNLVVNDLNAVSDVRNTIGTVKSIIKFFRDSPKRRARVPNIPLLCETRWTAKYKSIRVFTSNFADIFEKLEEIEMDMHESSNTRQTAHQLKCAASSSSFLVCLKIIAKYSAMLEPVTQQMQAVDNDLLKVKDYIHLLKSAITAHREEAVNVFSDDIMPEVRSLAEGLGISLVVPRRVARQTHRSNMEGSLEDYYRRVIFIPYLDSLIQSMEDRFGENNAPYFNLFALHPKEMKNIDRVNFKSIVMSIMEMYSLDNFEQEALVWYDIYSKKEMNDTSMIELLNMSGMFPAVCKALAIALSLPATTCTVERSFSTLRRVKTWLRSTMSDHRLSGLCMMSVHRQRVNADKTELIKKVIDKFGIEPRRLQFLFNE